MIYSNGCGAVQTKSNMQSTCKSFKSWPGVDRKTWKAALVIQRWWRSVRPKKSKYYSKREYS